MTDDSQGGLRGDQGVGTGQNDGTRDQMCKRISELEAARDHLRARLQRQIAQWRASAERWKQVESPPNNQPYADGRMHSLNKCAADLLAVLTEPQQQKNDEKPNTNADTRLAETDVIREVALPQRRD